MSEPVSDGDLSSVPEPAVSESDEPRTDDRPIVDSSVPVSESSLDVTSPHDREMKEAGDVQGSLD